MRPSNKTLAYSCVFVLLVFGKNLSAQRALSVYKTFDSTFVRSFYLKSTLDSYVKPELRVKTNKVVVWYDSVNPQRLCGFLEESSDTIVRLRNKVLNLRDVYAIRERKFSSFRFYSEFTGGVLLGATASNFRSGPMNYIPLLLFGPPAAFLTFDALRLFAVRNGFKFRLGRQYFLRKTNFQHH